MKYSRKLILPGMKSVCVIAGDCELSGAISVRLVKTEMVRPAIRAKREEEDVVQWGIGGVGLVDSL